jgi:hypothetical protein
LTVAGSNKTVAGSNKTVAGSTKTVAGSTKMGVAVRTTKDKEDLKGTDPPAETSKNG